MKRTLIITFALLSLLTVQAATRRALVIGIGDYPASSGWAKINGDKDIPMVEDMLTANGFDKQNIVKLKNEQATCSAICCEMEHLISQSQAGDFVYIHFSGHGQQITDLNGDETDGKDEAWIPYDAHFAFESGVYEGEHHLVDDQLNAYLHRLRQSVGADGKIIVVADACHSGDGSRGDEDETNEECIRGTDKEFTIANIKQTVKRFTSIFSKGKSDKISDSQITAPQPTPLEWIYISACKDYQCNSEFKGMGSLTTALSRVQNQLSSLTIPSLSKKLKSFYTDNIARSQTPAIETPTGAESAIFF